MAKDAVLRGRFTLEVPLDAAKAIQETSAEGPRAVKVQILSGGKLVATQLVKLDAKGLGLARFEFPERPDAVKVLVGSAEADDRELQGMEHLAVPVSGRSWKAQPELRITPIVIPYHHWHLWRTCCRTFTIKGRVLCPDGTPVPNALVTAFDVDWWWWWRSKQAVGTAYTDLAGNFAITFRWCCAWLPLWWWRRRRWLIDPRLYHIIADELRLDPHIPWPPRPMTKPDLSFFEELIGGRAHTAAPKAPQPFEPGVLDSLRQRLLPVLPPLREAERLRLWPWFPWYPWHDCTPDIIFKVTQDCKAVGQVIVDEDVSDVRWNIPTALNVTLHANDKACCLDGSDPDPSGLCAMVDGACWGSWTGIGGHDGAPAGVPAGYRSDKDRPFAGTVIINGAMGDEVDYYAFDYSTDGGASWQDLPQEALGAFDRQYIEPGGPHPWPVTNAPVRMSLDNRLVYESRSHYMATHDPASWGATRLWMSVNQTVLMPWLTTNTVENGTFRLRAKAFTLGGDGHLADAGVLTFCLTEEVVPLVLAIDNRKVEDGTGHPPSSDSHPCGAGSIHACTLEPETAILSVKIHGLEVGPCGVIDASGIPPGEVWPLEVVFAAHDRADETGLGHLDRFSLKAVYKSGQATDLIDLGALSAGDAPSGGIPVADVVAADYWEAVALGAVRPNWRGGVFKVRVEDFTQVFPETCSYALELWACKRNLVSCATDQFWNRSVMTFAVKR